MSDDFLSPRRKALEESFFRRRDAELLEQMKQQASKDSAIEALAAASGIEDESLLNRLVDLELSADTVAALSLVPLVQVAWADGNLEAKEREAIVAAAVESGIKKDSSSYRMLSQWLATKPEDDLATAWNDYVGELIEAMSSDEVTALRDGLVARAQKVAESAGGILGIGKVSDAETKAIDALRAAFG
jgi:hypothetical protein